MGNRQRMTENIVRGLDASALIASSLAPISALMAIRTFGSHDRWTLLFSVLFLCGLLGALRFLLRSRESDDFTPRVTRVDEAGGEVAAYLASFVFPFLTVSSPTTQDVISYVVFACVYIGVLWSTNLIAVNPLLFVFGLKIWRVESSDFESGSAIVIGRHRPMVGAKYAMSGDRRIYVEAKKGE
jgi:hypothetical protein